MGPSWGLKSFTEALCQASGREPGDSERPIPSNFESSGGLVLRPRRSDSAVAEDPAGVGDREVPVNRPALAVCAA